MRKAQKQIRRESEELILKWERDWFQPNPPTQDRFDRPNIFKRLWSWYLEWLKEKEHSGQNWLAFIRDSLEFLWISCFHDWEDSFCVVWCVPRCFYRRLAFGSAAFHWR